MRINKLITPIIRLLLITIPATKNKKPIANNIGKKSKIPIFILKPKLISLYILFDFYIKR